ncbi:hypothetical protein [Enterococcus faecalis]|nr:hypothetical protein [Enterococcus faecalis]MDW0302998.1 hypothetical protein [Enterococcus faecalis]
MMELTVLQLLNLEEGLIELAEKEMHISTSLKLNRALTEIGTVTHCIRETAQPILKKEECLREKELQELYKQEMNVELPTITINELAEVKVSAKLLHKIQPILEEVEE